MKDAPAKLQRALTAEVEQWEAKAMMLEAMQVTPPAGGAAAWGEKENETQLERFAAAAAGMCADGISSALLTVWPSKDTRLSNDEFETAMAVFLGVPPPLLRGRQGEEIRAPTAGART